MAGRAAIARLRGPDRQGAGAGALARGRGRRAGGSSIDHHLRDHRTSEARAREIWATERTIVLAIDPAARARRGDRSMFSAPRLAALAPRHRRRECEARRDDDRLRAPGTASGVTSQAPGSEPDRGGAHVAGAAGARARTRTGV